MASLGIPLGNWASADPHVEIQYSDERRNWERKYALPLPQLKPGYRVGGVRNSFNPCMAPFLVRGRRTDLGLLLSLEKRCPKGSEEAIQLSEQFS